MSASRAYNIAAGGLATLGTCFMAVALHAGFKEYGAGIEMFTDLTTSNKDLLNLGGALNAGAFLALAKPSV